VPDNGEGRAPRQRPGPAQTFTATYGPASITDLADWRQRRLLPPWPGWWGDAEVRSWTWAERSRRAS
jgi:hypothetical protein